MKSKTAEEILETKNPGEAYEYMGRTMVIPVSSAIAAMEEYASQFQHPVPANKSIADLNHIVINACMNLYANTETEAHRDIDKIMNAVKSFTKVHPVPDEAGDKLPLEWSPVESEKKWQQEQFKKLFPNIGNDQPDWQRLNFFLNTGVEFIEGPKNKDVTDLMNALHGLIYGHKMNIQFDTPDDQHKYNASLRFAKSLLVSPAPPSGEDAGKGWIRFEDKLPEVGQEVFIVWPSMDITPEYRVLNEDDLNQNWETMRWMPVPNYHPKP